MWNGVSIRRVRKHSGVVAIPVMGWRVLCRRVYGMDFDFLFSLDMAGKGNVPFSGIACRSGRDTFLMAFAVAGGIGGGLHVMLQGFLRPDRDDVDEERNEHADQGIEHAVYGKAGNAAVGSVRDSHTQESDTGNVRQGVFAHEIDEILEWSKRKGVFFGQRVVFMFEMMWFFDDLCQKHQRDDAKRNQEIGQNGMGIEIDAPNQEKHKHTGETTDEGTDCPVQSDTERTLDFRLQADHGRDGRIERRTGSDVEKKIDQTADKNGYRCLDNDNSHIKLIIKIVFVS